MGILEAPFFARSAIEVAQDLVGKYLVRRWGGEEHAHRIKETEAYHGREDKASHASRGRTKRNAVMFGEAGYLYVYLVYGVYDMLNVVTGATGEPSAVLIRGIEGYEYRTVREAKRVSECIESVRRLPLLPWSHHQEFAKLDPAAQTWWLEKAQG